MNLRAYLSGAKVDEELRRVIAHLGDSAKYIDKLVRNSTDREHVGTVNSSGEEQMALDVQSDKIIEKRLKDETSFGVLQLASEEQEEIVQIDSDKGKYSVAVDPLDGSSLLEPNLSVGTIMGIYDGPLLNERPGRESIVAALSVLYGRSTTMIYADGNSAQQFILDPTGSWILDEDNKSIALNERGNINSPGGLEREWTKAHGDFIKSLRGEGYKLRYSGALVADANQILMSGGGIFTYPALQNRPNGKLRLLFELQPMALIMESVNGRATNGLVDILDLTPTQLDERSPIYMGSQHEVERAAEYLKG